MNSPHRHLRHLAAVAVLNPRQARRFFAGQDSPRHAEVANRPANYFPSRFVVPEMSRFAHRRHRDGNDNFGIDPRSGT